MINRSKVSAEYKERLVQLKARIDQVNEKVKTMDDEVVAASWQTRLKELGKQLLEVEEQVEHLKDVEADSVEALATGIKKGLEAISDGVEQVFTDYIASRVPATDSTY